MKIIIWIAFTFLSGFLYHLGGLGDDGWRKYQHIPRWIFNTKTRDVGCSLVDVLAVGLLVGWSWWLVPCFGLNWAALTTYWKKKGTDATWLNWWMTGFMYGVAFLPYAFATHRYIGFLLRCFILGTTTAIWSHNIDDANMEEGGRGGLMTFSLPLLKF